MRRLVAWYGAGPLHLLALLAGGALSAYAVSRITPVAMLWAIAVWFAGTLIAHDLVLFPFYAAADNAGSWLQRRAARPTGAPWINHVRVPTLLSGVLFLAWFPLILRLAPGYQRVSGRSDDPFLGRWLVLSGVLFAVSALAYVARSARARSHRP